MKGETRPQGDVPAPVSSGLSEARRWVKHLLFSSTPRMRLMLKRTLPAALIYQAFMLVQWEAVVLGFVEPAAAAGFIAVLFIGSTGFYLAVRSGWSQRFGDASLSMPQMVFAIFALATAYQINWHVRGVMTTVAALVLVFGAFELGPKACRRLGWLSMVAFGASMLVGAVREPARFPPLIELLHFACVLLVLPVVGLLAGQLSRLRLDQRQQKRELKEALAKLQLTATQDELTGLPNRRHMQAWMARESARIGRTGHPLCLAVIDLDNFKAVNDRHGHPIGDEALRIFGHEARAALREGDVLARWGGEEFLLAMPETPIEGATRLLERLRSKLSDPSSWAACPQAQVTFSAGLTTHVQSQTMHDTVRRADDALYAAKREGRNRLIVA